MANKRLSKAQRRALEIIAQGGDHDKQMIRQSTQQWMINNDLVQTKSLITDKGKAWLDADRQLAPIVQCQYCGNWRDMGGKWTESPITGAFWAWWCNGDPNLPDNGHYDDWYPGSTYPEWIADE